MVEMITLSLRTSVPQYSRKISKQGLFFFMKDNVVLTVLVFLSLASFLQSFAQMHHTDLSLLPQVSQTCTRSPPLVSTSFALTSATRARRFTLSTTSSPCLSRAAATRCMWAATVAQQVHGYNSHLTYSRRTARCLQKCCYLTYHGVQLLLRSSNNTFSMGLHNSNTHTHTNTQRASSVVFTVWYCKCLCIPRCKDPLSYSPASNFSLSIINWV